MAPVRMKTRADIGLKETAFKPKHAPVVSKRKADGSPLKPATTGQVKRHLVDESAKENQVLLKTKAQLQAVKKPLGLRNVNANNLDLISKAVKAAALKKESVIGTDAKENIATLKAKFTDTKLVATKVTSVTVKNKETKVVKVQESKVSEVKKLVKPLGGRDVNRILVKEEPKSKPKTELKVIPETKENVVLKPVENRRTSLIPVPKKPEPQVRTTGPVTRQSLSRKSTDNEQSTLYESALEDIFQNRLVLINSLNDTSSAKKSVKPLSFKQIRGLRKRPPGVEDFDAASQDLFSVGKYAFEIFEYLKSREPLFKVSNYMLKQKNISKNMRALLVDWLVEIQESFELNHETLYLAVKLIDLYLSKVSINKGQLQLLGSTAMLIACKYDERMAPLVDDFVAASDNNFTAKDVMNLEFKVLKAVNYDIGCPLSYRFLRRYSRCAKLDMSLLTLARYILEMSLTEYSMSLESESKLAAAALYLALRMKNESTWTPTLEYYSGYKLEEFKDIVLNLNTMLHQKKKEKLMTIRKKYSHQIFHCVATLPLLDEVDFPEAT